MFDGTLRVGGLLVLCFVPSRSQILSGYASSSLRAQNQNPSQRQHPWSFNGLQAWPTASENEEECFGGGYPAINCRAIVGPSLRDF